MNRSSPGTRALQVLKASGIPAVLIVVLSVLLSGAAPGQVAPKVKFDERAKFLRSTAVGAISSGRHEDAVAPLKRLLENYPDAYQETIWLAQSYHALGLFEEEVELLEGAARRWPSDYQVSQMLGAAYLETGDRDRAVEVWHAALRQEGAGVMTYIQIARAEWDAGMYDRAIATLEEARKFRKHYARVTSEIVRMEKTRGNERGAFLAAVDGFEHADMPDIARAGEAVRSFRASSRKDALLRTVDSLAAAGGKNRTFFRTLGAALLVETDDYVKAGPYLTLAERGEVEERHLYSLVIRLYSLGGKFGDPQFEAYLERAASIFVVRFDASPRAPRVLLEGAEHAAAAAGRGGADEKSHAARAVAMADSAAAHKRGRAYAEKATLLKARVLLEHLHDPVAAVRAVDSRRWRHPELAREAHAVRLEALVLSGRWDEATRRFDELIESPDSSLAVSGKYGKGMVLFYSGEFEESGKLLSEVAEEAPWSKWANDALAAAVLVRRAGMEEPAVLDAFASAMRASRSGEYGAAADSLMTAAEGYPHSSLAPEAMLEGAHLMAREGRSAEARTALEKIVEAYPLSRAAPRAVETLASMAEESDPQEAASWYALFLERYGDDPWATRIRARYMRLRRSVQEES